MHKHKIFLASSSELKNDRQKFEIFLYRKSKSWVDKGIFIDLILWEDFIDAMAQTRLQDKYNQAIRGCDLFVMLFSSKVGKYTAEEFATAFGSFKKTNRPLIYTYFKESQISTGSVISEDLKSRKAFQDLLNKLGHFQTKYKNTDELLLKFGQQLDKLADSGFITLQADKQHSNENPTISQTHSGTGNNVAGKQTKIGRQINMGENSSYHEHKSKK